MKKPPHALLISFKKSRDAFTQYLIHMEKVAIIGSVGYPSRYGGFETLVHHLVHQLKDKRQLTVYCSRPHYKPEERRKYIDGVRLVYIPVKANGIQSVLYDSLSVFHALFRCDTLLILGVSGCLMLPFLRIFTRKKLVVNIDGLEWKRDKWNSAGKRFLKFAERVAVKWAHITVADNAVIQQYVQEEYRKPSQLIEYGADHVSPSLPDETHLEKYPFLHDEYAFKVARIEPENNIALILQAFSETNCPLVMVGNWNYSAYGKELRHTYGRFPHIHLLDPIYDQRQLDVLRSNCKWYVHGHTAGGTNPSLVEAMYLGLNILAFDVNYNRETTENQAYYFHSAHNLQELIRQLQQGLIPENKSVMKEIAFRRYTWSIVSEKYNALLSKNVYIQTNTNVPVNTNV